jgi:hypothetical protein
LCPAADAAGHNQRVVSGADGRVGDQRGRKRLADPRPRHGERGGRDHKHRAAGLVDHVVRDAAEDQRRDVAATAGSDHDEARVELVGDADDRVRRRVDGTGDPRLGAEARPSGVFRAFRCQPLGAVPGGGMGPLEVMSSP